MLWVVQRVVFGAINWLENQLTIAIYNKKCAVSVAKLPKFYINLHTVVNNIGRKRSTDKVFARKEFLSFKRTLNLKCSQQRDQIFARWLCFKI